MIAPAGVEFHIEPPAFAKVIGLACDRSVTHGTGHPHPLGRASALVCLWRRAVYALPPGWPRARQPRRPPVRR